MKVEKFFVLACVAGYSMSVFMPGSAQVQSSAIAAHLHQSWIFSAQSASLANAVQEKQISSTGERLLTAGELEAVIPATVFFRGQRATVQLRNAAGIRFADGLLMFAVKVDTGGYSSGIAERYQDYLVTESPLRFGSKVLPPGAYGIGFVPEGMVVMDLGARTLMTLPSINDDKLRRPSPLQIVEAEAGGKYRIYSGRTYVSFQASAAN